MSSSIQRLSKLSALTILIVLLTASASQAVTWGVIRAYYNGVARAEGNGNFFNESYVNARNDFRLNDPSNDGNNAYGFTNFFFYYSGGWHNEGRRNTGEYTYANTPVTKILRFPLDQIGTAARGSSQVCGQLGFPIPDVCSNAAVPTFSY